MFEPLDQLIKRKKGINHGILFSTQVCFEAEGIINKLMPEIKDKFKIVSFKDGRLKVSAIDSIILYQIKMKEGEIKKKLQKKVRIKPFVITYLPQE